MDFNNTCFSQFYSNEKAKQTLVQFAADGRLPHAILFEGPVGCGKTFLAQLTAAAALCQQLGGPCGLCRACRLTLAGTHPDVAVLSPDSPEKPYSVKALRELILSCYVLPNDGDKKIYILRDIHKMSEQAQNTLLKMIEEPPAHVMFLLTCTSRAQILPTILSRVVTIMLTTCPVEECAQALQNRLPQCSAQECAHAARLTGGNIGKALLLLQDEALSQLYRTAREAVELLCCKDEFQLLCLLRPASKKKEDFSALLSNLQELFLEIVKEKNAPSAPALGNEGKLFPDAVINRITTLQAVQIIDIIRKVQAELAQNVSPALASAQLCGLCKEVL